METAFFKNNEVEVSHDSDCDFVRVRTERLALTLVIGRWQKARGKTHGLGWEQSEFDFCFCYWLVV